MQYEKFVISMLSGALLLGPALTAQTEVQRRPLARVGERTIYDEDLLPSISGQLWQLKTQEYDLKNKALINLVNDRLVENEAKKKGISVDAFWEETVDRSVPAPTPAEVQAYYLALKERIPRPFEDVKPQLEQSLIQAKRQQARQALVDQLRGKADVTIMLTQPKMDVTADPNRVRGNPDAPVTIVEFSDFQCPYCQAAQPTIKAVLDKYKGTVRLSFRDFPLRQIHGQAQQAAEAARCAGDQGKFWEYHDLLFANQSLDSANLTQNAEKAGLDAKRFSTCLSSGRFKQLIENDLQMGMISGITGTPAFFINGTLLGGNQPLSEFEKVINSQLTRASGHGESK